MKLGLLWRTAARALWEKRGKALAANWWRRVANRRKNGASAAVALAVALSGAAQAQTTVAPGQLRSGDFSANALTKPARTVSALPATCSPGELVYLTTASGASRLNACTSTNVWTALGGAVHTHSLTDVAGVSGKQGDGALLMAFGGGTTASGDCAQFDAAGNIISAGGPCGSGGGTAAANARVVFTSQTSVTMTHNRGTRDVLVGCYDTSNAMLEPDRVVVLDTNRVQIQFAAAQSGTCVLNASGGGSGESPAGPAVTSVFGRTGDVAAQAGDYSFAQINGTASVSQGGTGAATPAAARENLLPGYAANPGKCLAVNTGGTDVEWTECGSGGGGAYVAGLGITIDGNEIGVAASVPTFLTGAGSVTLWNGESRNIPAQSCLEKTFTMTGAREADGVSAGWPATLPMGLSGTMYVGASDMVVVRLCNATAVAVAVADGLTFRATIVRSF